MMEASSLTPLHHQDSPQFRGATMPCNNSLINIWKLLHGSEEAPKKTNTLNAEHCNTDPCWPDGASTLELKFFLKGNKPIRR